MYGNCKNGCEVLAELGLEAKPRPPSPLHAQHTMHAPASASASLQASASRHPAASASGSSDGGWTLAGTAAATTTAASSEGTTLSTIKTPPRTAEPHGGPRAPRDLFQIALVLLLCPISAPRTLSGWKATGGDPAAPLRAWRRHVSDLIVIRCAAAVR